LPFESQPDRVEVIEVEKPVIKKISKKIKRKKRRGYKRGNNKVKSTRHHELLATN